MDGETPRLGRRSNRADVRLSVRFVRSSSRERYECTLKAKTNEAKMLGNDSVTSESLFDLKPRLQRSRRKNDRVRRGCGRGELDGVIADLPDQIEIGLENVENGDRLPGRGSRGSKTFESVGMTRSSCELRFDRPM